MLNQLPNIKKLLFLGVAIASTKVMLLLFAYFFDAGSFGFNVVTMKVDLYRIYFNSRLIIET
ncbi:MAG: hypothetical protein DYG97_15775 [Ignavibacteria bacterium CHB3]|nr:hypothetical protein [Ignavibacteria bacterium CHB3]